MAKDLVHKIREFPIGTKISEVEEFRNRDDITNPELHIAQKDTVERHASHIVRPARGSSEHDEDEWAYNHVTVNHIVYIIHYRQKNQGEN